MRILLVGLYYKSEIARLTPDNLKADLTERVVRVVVTKNNERVVIEQFLAFV